MIAMPNTHQASPALSRDIIHLKTLLQRERQIAEERLRALEHRDALLAAADTRRKTSHTDSARRRDDLSLAERRLNEERNKRAELQRIADELKIAVDIYKQGQVDIRHKLIELIEKESWRINEHPRDIPEKTLSLEDLAPKEAQSLIVRLLEKLVLFTNTATDRQRTELLERSRARQDLSNQRIEELESRSRVLEQDLKAAQDARTELESRLRLAESEKIQLKLEMDLARSELANERVTRDQTIEKMKLSIEDCRLEIANMMSESDSLRAHCASVEEAEAHHRELVEAMRQQVITLQAQVDFCNKHHVFESNQSSPFRSGTSLQTPQLPTTGLPPTQTTEEVMSVSAPSSSRIDFPDPIVPSITSQQQAAAEQPPTITEPEDPVPSQPSQPTKPRRVTRARRAAVDTETGAETLLTSSSSVTATKKGGAKLTKPKVKTPTTTEPPPSRRQRNNNNNSKRSS